jgi:hypothetical protein
VPEDLFAGDDVGTNGARNKIPSIVSDQGTKFFFHGAVLVQIDEGSTNGCGRQSEFVSW